MFSQTGRKESVIAMNRKVCYRLTYEMMRTAIYLGKVVLLFQYI